MATNPRDDAYEAGRKALKKNKEDPGFLGAKHIEKVSYKHKDHESAWRQGVKDEKEVYDRSKKR